MIKIQNSAIKHFRIPKISASKAKVAALILPLLILSASCSSPSRLVSISEPRIDPPAKVDYLQWRTGYGRWFSAGRASSSASGLIRDFSRYSRTMPFPLAMWAADNTRSTAAFEYPSHRPYAEALEAISAWAGPYKTSVSEGFVEVAWADAENEKKIRDSMSERVPPILFQSRNAADFLYMWHVISGMEFMYDPELVESSNAYDRARLMDESDPDLSLTDIPNRPFPLGFTQFVSSRTLDITDFMNLLAAHVGGSARRTWSGWVIEKFQRNEQSLRLIDNCITRIRQAAFQGSSEPIEILSRIGSPALPELLREFHPVYIDKDINKQINGARDAMHLNRMAEINLIWILSRISSPERDEALLSALKYKTHDFPEFIIRALAATRTQAAAPIFEQLATSAGTEPQIRIAARVGLNALGKPLIAAPENDLSAIPSVQSLLETEKGNQAKALLRAVLNQCDQYEEGMQIQSVDLDSSSTVVLWGRYGKRTKFGSTASWTFEIPVMRSDRSLARLYVPEEKIPGEGYLAWLKKQDGRWLVTKWQPDWSR